MDIPSGPNVLDVFGQLSSRVNSTGFAGLHSTCIGSIGDLGGMSDVALGQLDCSLKCIGQRLIQHSWKWISWQSYALYLVSV